jgi:hypothetical protein
MPRDSCQCPKCAPYPGAKPHPVYGFDLNKVKDTLCLICDKPIGNESYELDTSLARFGRMLFIHKRCARKSNQVKNAHEAIKKIKERYI